MKVEQKLNHKDTYKKYKFFPGKLLYEDEFPFHVVIGVKGDGKTFWKLLNMIKIFKRGMHTIEIAPTKEKIKEILRYKNYFERLYVDQLKEGIRLDHDLTNEEITDFLDGLDYKNDSIWKDEKLVVRFVPLLGLDKNKDIVGTKTEWIVQDEAFTDSYDKKTSYGFQLILDTVFRKRKDLKITMLGNAVSLNHPLFIILGVFQLDENLVVNIIKGETTKKTILKVWNWKRDLKEIKDSYDGGYLYDLFTETGYADFAFKNEFKNDNLSNVVKISDNDVKKYCKLQHIFRIEELFIDFYMIEAKYSPVKDDQGKNRTIYYFKGNRQRDISEIKYALTRDEVNDNIKFRPDVAYKMSDLLMNNLFYYDSIAVSIRIKNVLQRFFSL